jgi:hypothetical protein
VKKGGDHKGRPYNVARRTGKWGDGAVMAAGYGGQTIAVVQSKRLVAVQTVDLTQNPKGVPTRTFLDFVEKIANTMP